MSPRRSEFDAIEALVCRSLGGDGIEPLRCRSDASATAGSQNRNAAASAECTLQADLHGASTHGHTGATRVGVRHAKSLKSEGRRLQLIRWLVWEAFPSGVNCGAGLDLSCMDGNGPEEVAMAFVNRWNGEYFGWIEDSALYTRDGRHVGRLEGFSIFANDGSYLGEVRANRLLANVAKKVQRQGKGFIPSEPKVLPLFVNPLDEVALRVPPEDFPAPDTLT